MTVYDERSALISDLENVKRSIEPEFRAFEDDESPGIQYTLASNDDGSEYAVQTGDNSYTGAAYGFPHWAVVGVYKDSDCAALADELLDELRDLTAWV